TGEVRLWDAATGNPLGDPMRHDDEVRSLSFSPDGSRIVTASEHITTKEAEARTWARSKLPPTVTASGQSTTKIGEARLWDTAKGKPLGERMRHEGTVHRVGFSRDSSNAVTGGEDEKAEVRLWDAATGKPLGEPIRDAEVVSDAIFSPDGSKIVTNSYDV